MSDLMVTHRAVVFPWQCGHDGHMNTRFFFNHFDDAAFQVWPVIGFPHSRMRELGSETVSARYTMDFHTPIGPGQMLAINSGITRVGNKSVTHGHWLRNSENGQLCASMQCVEVCFDTNTRSSAPMPDALREFLNERLIDSPADMPASRRVIDSYTTGQDRYQWHDTYRDTVHPWYCDHFRHMNARYYGHHFDDAMPHLYGLQGCGPNRLAQYGLARRVAHCELSYIKELTAGTQFVVQSAFTALGNSSVAHQHRLLHGQSGELHATFRAVDVLVSSESGAATPLPDDLRHRLLASAVERGQ